MFGGGYIGVKKCKKCGKVKDITEFYKHKETKDGYRNSCKECVKKQNKKWRENNKEYKKEINKKWREKNIEYCKEYRKKQYEENKERERKNRRRWSEENKERERETRKKWKSKNPDKLAAHKANRRAMKHALPYTTSSEVWLDVIMTYDSKCAVTGKEKFDLEHMIPLSWGHGGSLKNNIYPMDSTLNMSKSNKNPFKFAKQLKGKQRKNFEKVLHNLAKENGMTYKEYHKYVNWCEKNKRTVEQVIADNEKGLSSIDLWKNSLENS